MGFFRNLRYGNIVLTPQYVSKMYYVHLENYNHYDLTLFVTDICLDRYEEKFEFWTLRINDILSLVEDLGGNNLPFKNSDLMTISMLLRRLGLNGDLTLISLSILILETSFLEMDLKTQTKWIIEIVTELHYCHIPSNLIVTKN